MSTQNDIPLGLCQCGCGKATTVYSSSWAARGIVKGQPRPYRRGHHWHKHARYTVEDRGYETPCHIWQLAKDAQGYGRVGVSGRVLQAHRVEYERRFGSLADDVQIHHRCEQKSCVNPEHLEPMTPATHSQTHARRLTWEDVREIRRLRASGVLTTTLAAQFGVNAGRISEIVNHKGWKAS